MSEEQAQYHITTEKGVSELIIRHGEAKKIYYPKALMIRGDISSPREIHSLRYPGETDCILKCNQDAGTIILEIFPEHAQVTHVITGIIETDTLLEKLKINSGARFTPETLADMLKKYRSLFLLRDEFMKVVAALKTLKGKIHTEIEKISDARGNRRELVDKVVSSNVPENFTMYLPPFKGFEPKSFLIEIEIESRENEISCLLTSVELNDYIMQQRDELMRAECDYFRALKIPVIIQ